MQRNLRCAFFAMAMPALIMSAVPASAQGCNPGECIRVGSYNIKLFGNPGAPADEAAEFDQLAERIASPTQADLDVVVLQEINKADDAWKGAGGLLERLRKSGYEVAIEGKFGGDEPDRQQFVIMLHRTKTVSLVAGSAGDVDIPTAFDVGGSCEYKSLRSPVTALLKSTAGNFSFRLVGVHLKSQNRVGNSDDCDDRIRAFQAEKIVAFLDKMKSEKGEANFVIVGDFNASFKAPEYDALRKSDYQTMIDGACSSTKVDQCSFVATPHLSIIDHVVVPAGLKQAVTGSGTIGKAGDVKKYLKTQSDHVPVWASFRTN